MHRKLLAFLLILVAAAVVFCGATSSLWADEPEGQISKSIDWQSNYCAAVARARQERAMLLLWFFDPDCEEENQALERDVFQECAVAWRLTSCVPVKLPTHATHTSLDPPGKAIRLLDHPAFEELLGGRGLALIDLREEASPQFHRVVSVYPFSAEPITSQQLIAMLDLPDGTLTQRTLIWAVRTHAEQPASAAGDPSPIMMREAAEHAEFQARLGVQGHHNWDARFQRINEKLRADLVAQEVCAESWPHQGLVEAAVECVHSWRQSSGHWDAVRTRHPLFGFDMQRGSNGIWYATGIFGRRR